MDCRNNQIVFETGGISYKAYIENGMNGIMLKDVTIEYV